MSPMKIWCALVVLSNACWIQSYASGDGHCADGVVGVNDGSCVAGNDATSTPDAVDADLQDQLEDYKEDDACVDTDVDCDYWAGNGECETNPGFMLSGCCLSCSTVGETKHGTESKSEDDGEAEEETCEDKDEKCEYWADIGECEVNPGYMLGHCRLSCSVCQIPIRNDLDFGEKQHVPSADAHLARKVDDVIKRSVEYMRDEVMQKPEFKRIRRHCRNTNGSCSLWAARGDCERNREFMERNCAPACHTCEKLDVKYRCPLDPNAPAALKPGDLNRMFDRILTDPEYSKYKPVVLSRPENAESVNSDDGSHHDGPWVVSFDNFLTDEECDRLISLGHKLGYEKSTSVGALRPDGSFGGTLDEARTSENTWCWESCDRDPLAKAVRRRIANVTGVPEENSENLQLLKYNVGQYYNRHHDFIEFQAEQQCGVRVLTFFLYLNDVEAGGGTKFEELGDLVVTPKKGKAVLWPSVLDSDPHAKDPRTDHEAMPVERGVKYGANAWLHMHDFQGAQSRGCTG